MDKQDALHVIKLLEENGAEITIKVLKQMIADQERRESDNPGSVFDMVYGKRTPDEERRWRNGEPYLLPEQWSDAEMARTILWVKNGRE